MDKYDISQLTEFPRYEPESAQSGVTTFFNKLWKFPIFSPSESTENMQEKSSTAIKENAEMSEEQKKQEYDDSKTETGSYAVEFEGRSLPNVLRRISSLIAMGSGGQGTRYADTELARYWMPDDISRECYECALRFSTLRRRHHCRVCGQIFCSRCCSQRVPGQIFGCAGGLRVCNYCCNVVLSYLKENDMSGEISPDLRTLQENLQVKFPENRSASGKSRDNFMFAREQEERCETRPTPTEALHDLYRRLTLALPQQQHRYRLVRYNGVWRGCDILQWVMDNTSYKTRFQASQVCQNLLSSGYMECVSELLQFADYALYRPTAPPAEPTDPDTPEEGGRLLESVSSYCLDLNLGNNSARLIKAPKQESKSTPSSEDDPNPVLEQSDGCSESKNVCKAILESGEDHLRLLLRQCLARESLPAGWLTVLLSLCHRAAEIVMPDMNSSDIDVRNYVQVKKVPGGTMKDSCVVNGVVLTKNVAHRGMPQEITNPTILLLDCSIAYQRVEGKLTSLEPVLLQEQQYLVRCAARITALQPSLVLVRGGAARGVQDALRAAGVAMATRVRDRALSRTARCTRADLVASIDARIGTPRLGTADKFYVKNYSNKTLMVLEGCAEQNLGCSILLRGASLQELVRVKKIVKFMLLACYNWKLEKAFLGDIEAVLPEPGMTFDDDKNDDTFNNEALDREDTDCSESVLSNDDWESAIANSKSKTSNSVEVKNSNEPKKSQEPDDPLQRTKPFRKTDSDKNFSCGVPIRDFSDPLRATLDDEVFLPKEEAKLKADDHIERWSTDDVVLSMSPNTIIPTPYLETEAGRKCAFREYFPQPLLRVPTKAPHTPRTLQRKISKPQQSAVILKEMHPFIRNPLKASADDPSVRAALAHYRATGGRLQPDTHAPECPLYKPSVLKKSQKEPEIETEKPADEPLDPLAPENHQQLSMLIYSYSSKSANVPDFCVNPWIVKMELYGKHDISLGGFLEKYCFNPDYKCPSTNCQVPMNQHVRRFVHGDVCITITCNAIGHSNVDKMREDRTKQVMFWSRCETCGATGRARRLSTAALGLSLGSYMRGRVLGACGLRTRVCPHPLHAHSHAFARPLSTACVRYSKISTFDIKLPPKVIATKYDTKKMREALIQQLNDLMLKGHEIFSGVTDSEAEKDQQNFKQHTDQILVALTSSNLQEHTSLAGVVRSLWVASDRLIAAEKMLRDAQDRWLAPQRHTKPHVDATVEEKSDIEDSAGESANDSSGTTYVFASDNTSKEITGTEEDEEKGDKKTVRQILSQLLSNNQPSNQVGIIISSGVLPVVVRAGDIGSVIAATLASITYQRTVRQQRHSTQTEPEDSENSVNTKDKTDGDKSKAAKSNDHIEVLLKDGLLCRVYYALQFQRLRHLVLAPLSDQHITDEFAPTATRPESELKCCQDDKDKTDAKTLCEIEEGFIRSLAHCVPWAARGGKSGSTFCKTKDDRYVLKEMTKPEWQQFLEFAPHYFNYVINCLQNNIPSLLARIVGVYSVGGAGNGILVMENIWYGCGANASRFDLKGSSRHRLVADTEPSAVLMDKNLLHLRWETQLYVMSHTGTVLWSCVERDTSFLAAHCVMDYSLLLGVGSDLVLGLIDYIRTFTWDKKLEHLVKKNLGSGQPTVVSPAEYKRRFCAAARKYFLQCPSHWDHLYKPLTT